MLRYGLYNIPASDPSEIFYVLSISRTVGFEGGLFFVKKAGRLAKFSSWFTLVLYVVLL